MAVKFPLKMADGAMVRTLEELREHFDIASLLSYYDDGRLVKWLENGYYDDEAQKVSELDVNSENFAKDLCEVLGIENADDEKIKNISVKKAAERNSRIAKLRQFTVDDNILSAVDRVAFTQEELDALLKGGAKEVFLCGESFTANNISGVTYIGVNNPIVRYDEATLANGIDFQDLEVDLDWDKYISCYMDYKTEVFFTFFEKNLSLGFKLLHIIAEKGWDKAQTFLGDCYCDGAYIEKNSAAAFKWYKAAAEQGNADAQTGLGKCYYYGRGVEQDYSKAVKWFRKGAELGYDSSKIYLGDCYYYGIGVEEDETEAVKWYKKAAEQDNADAQNMLGECYYYGNGVEQDYSEAVKWYTKAVEQGHENAKTTLLKFEPSSFRISEVIICAVGGIENINQKSTINKNTGTIDIHVENRHKIDEAMFYKYGAEKVWVEPIYTTVISYVDDPNPLGTYLKAKFQAKPGDPPPIFGGQKAERNQEDLGLGIIHITFNKITQIQEEDFNINIKSKL